MGVSPSPFAASLLSRLHDNAVGAGLAGYPPDNVYVDFNEDVADPGSVPDWRILDDIGDPVEITDCTFALSAVKLQTVGLPVGRDWGTVELVNITSTARNVLLQPLRATPPLPIATS
jgi:hypothetical protein